MCLRLVGLFVFLLAALSLSAQDTDHVLGRLLVHRRDAADDSRFLGTLRVHGARVHRRIGDSGVTVLDVPEDASDSLIESLQNSGDFDYVERDYYAQAAAVPNDPSFVSQWHLAKIQAPQAWDITTGSTGILVAVIDSGANPGNRDLAPKLVPGWNFVSGTGDTTDILGHGTAVAGTIAAATNNSLGIAGVTWNSQILPLVVLDSNSYASYSNIAAAIQYAADHGVRVINISIGGSMSSYTLQAAVDYAWSKGAVVVASAMNNHATVPYYPAACSHVISVAATDQNDQRASFSNYGDWITVSAPGVSILTTNGAYYGYDSGTSFASPIVAGVLALAFAINPALTPAAATSLLTQNTDDLGTPGFDTTFGWGRVNAYKVVAAAKAQLTPPSISINPQITSIPAGQWKQFTATVMNSTAPVVWTVNPPLGDIFSTGAFHAPIALWTSQTVTVTVTAGNVSASAQVTILAGTASPAAFNPVYVNTGGPAYTDSQGITWSADTGYVGGAAQSVAGNISGTLSPTLYQSYHSGPAFSYQFAAPNGNYTVTLKFAEISKTGPGQRVFDVAVNGAPVLSGFDIFAQAGGAFTAIDRTFTAAAQNGQIAIQFTGTTGSAIVSAIKIVPAGMP